MSQIHLDQPADDLLEAALALSKAADAPGASAALGVLVPRLQESLRVLSASLYTLADDAVPELAERRRRGPTVRAGPASGLSREQEVQLVSTIHDLGAALTRCASSCDAVREIAVPLIAASGAERAERPAAPHTRADRRTVPARASTARRVSFLRLRGQTNRRADVRRPCRVRGKPSGELTAVAELLSERVRTEWRSFVR